MFWFRPKELNKIIPENILSLPFEKEPVLTDGSWAHVVERYIGAKVVLDGHQIVSI